MGIEFSGQALAPLLLGLLVLPLVIYWGANRVACWSLAKVIGGANLTAALVCWLAVLHAPLSFGVLHLGFVQATVLLLVSFLGWIVYRYAASNFQRDTDGPRFLRWLALTLLAVQTLLLVDYLVVFWMAWVAVSLSLHQLLLFYPDRPRALLAAHKKFLIARVSELLLAVAVGLIYVQFGSFSLSYTMSQLAQLPAGDMPWQLVVAASCLALVALLKCAQLPLHGWLIQVVESPTPVSALLHAGVINLGGVLLLLFAPLLSHVAIAQWLLLLVAGPSAVLAALIMTTRISIKVRLAWSTCAQMGLMLVECALGLYELALLHLLAHSCYKARAFLSAGSAVNQQLEDQLCHAVGCRDLPFVRHWLSAGLLVLLAITATAWALSSYAPALLGGSILPWLLISLALIFLVAQLFSQATQWTEQPGRILLSLFWVFALLGTYLVLKFGLAKALDLPAHSQNWLADVWVCGLILSLTLASYVLQRWPQHPRVHRAWIALNAGLYLDEWMSRLTLRWWPVTLTTTAVSPSFLSAEVKS